MFLNTVEKNLDLYLHSTKYIAVSLLSLTDDPCHKHRYRSGKYIRMQQLLHCQGFGFIDTMDILCLL